MDIIFYIALVVTSIIAVAFIVERGLALRWARVIPTPIARAVQNYKGPQDINHLQYICEQNPSPIARLITLGAEHADWPKSENVDVIETRARYEVSKLETGLVVLEIIVGIAPLLGLAGTIYGLITLFRSMNSATPDNAAFAQGISLALYATLLGLLIAIPTLVAWSYYTKKVEAYAVEMESLSDEFLRKHYRSDDTATATLDLPQANRA